MDICNGRVFATNITGSTFMGGVEGAAISNLVVTVTDRTLQFNHNYIMTMEVGKRNRSVLMLGDLSMLLFIGRSFVYYTITLCIHVQLRNNTQIQ